MKARGGEYRQQPFLRSDSGAAQARGSCREAAGRAEEGMCDLSGVVCLKVGQSGVTGENE